VALLFAPAGAWAATPLETPFAVAQVPLQMGGGVAPNLMYIHDDSGSMFWSFMPDDIYGSIYQKFMNSAYNKVYYNPAVIYDPPLDEKGLTLGDARFDDAWYDGYDRAGREGAGNYLAGATPRPRRVNLGVGWRPTYYYDIGYSTNTPYLTAYTGGKAAYYTGNGTAAGSTVHYVGESTDNVYPPGKTSATWDSAAQKRNFANWYAYYRTRNLAARAGISKAFAQLNKNIRVGYGKINYGVRNATTFFPVIVRGVRPYEDFGSSYAYAGNAYTDPPTPAIPAAPADAVYGNDGFRKQFYNWLFTDTTPTGSTPLRPALVKAGEYFASDEPWQTNPGKTNTDSPISCRRNITILMTDGYYNDDRIASYNPTYEWPHGNSDGTSGPNGYVTQAPFSDTASGTLGDIAMYYWKTDLRPTLANNVPTTAMDPANWQHMSTYTVGLGVNGGSMSTATIQQIFDAMIGVPLGSAIPMPAIWGYQNTNAWGNPITQADGDVRKSDDLIHAGINGRGGAYSADNPQAFADAMQAIVNSIMGDVTAVAPLSANSSGLTTDTLLFQATFNNDYWSGELIAHKLCTAANVASGMSGCLVPGTVIPTPAWTSSASGAIPAFGARNILTWNRDSKTGVPFLWANLTATQKSLLGSTEDTQKKVVNYLRGDVSQENAATNPLRSRGGFKLGDILSSAPTYVGAANYGYGSASVLTDAERSAYASRRSQFLMGSGLLAHAAARKQGTVYVGANDGMLHAFNTTTGKEVFAYIPDAVFPNLSKLTEPGYGHRYYVDGSPIAGDVLIDSVWHTLLVGSTGAGGGAYFALDVENPTNHSVLWELSTTDDNALGYTLGQAALVRTCTPPTGGRVCAAGSAGSWVAIFGNGVNSPVGKATLFVVDAKTGQVLAKVATDNTIDNGLMTPVAVDLNGDGAVDLIYAGDMKGNLWKFNAANANPTAWTATKLFTAKNGDGQAQPIYAKPQVLRHPKGGAMVYAGTGVFFQTGDKVNKDIQSFYGVWDECGLNTSCSATLPLTRTSLVQQTLGGSPAAVGSYGTSDLRQLSTHDVDYTSKKGFFFDLIYNAVKEGERIVTSAELRADVIFVGTVIPSGNACTGGSDGWLYGMTPFTGQRTQAVLFDLNGDGMWNNSDRSGGNGGTDIGNVVSGVRMGNFSIIGNRAQGNDVKDPPLTLNDVSMGRQSWIQIR
jgi:type IV pilus assembly protein PilY1